MKEHMFMVEQGQVNEGGKFSWLNRVRLMKEDMSMVEQGQVDAGSRQVELMD